tara:strand:+ start:31 stop:675 length:645 start_codon:yes stop_codon:yes gene_type:complete
MILNVIISYYRNKSWEKFVRDINGFKYKYHVYLYNKSGVSLFPQSNLISVLPLKNIGRESETYLTYIIDNYDTLTDYSLFIQDDVNNHIVDNKIFIEKCQEIMEKNEKFFLFPVTWRPGIGPLIRRIRNGRTKLPAGVGVKAPPGDAIFKMCDYNDVKLPKEYKTETCAFFICHKDMIRSRSRDFYVKLREWLLTDNRNGYVLEHCWKIIFVEN